MRDPMTRLPRRLLLKMVPAAALTASACSPRNLSTGRLPNLTAGLRAMTFNIQSARRGLDGIAQLIRQVEPDVVALQEVDRFSTRANGLDQAAELAERTGMGHCCHFRATRYFQGDYGVALISRYPLEEQTQVQLPRLAEEEPRTVGRARITVRGQPVSVYVTHLANALGNTALRKQQSQAILALIEADPHAKLVMGDLNDGADSDAVRVLSGALRDAFDTAGEGPSGTYPLPLFLPTLRLDYVMASSELRPLRSFVIQSQASDHYPLVAEFHLEEAAVQQVAVGL